MAHNSRQRYTYINIYSIEIILYITVSIIAYIYDIVKDIHIHASYNYMINKYS